VSARINLASRPFRNERPLTLLAVIGALALVALSVQHALVLREQLAGRTSVADGEAERLGQELATQRESLLRLEVPEPERELLTHWRLVEELVDRRTFSWTGLLSLLEEVLPRDVRLVSISPRTSAREFRLELIAVARTQDVALSFFGQLEARPEFSQVYPQRLAEVAGGTELLVSMGYHPAPVSSAGVPSEDAEGASPEAESAQAPEADSPRGGQGEEGEGGAA
jgi:hypothetical protein